MDIARATDVFSRTIYERDADALSKKIAVPVESISASELGRDEPTGALFYFDGPGSNFDVCAEWVVKKARLHGYAHAGLDFNGHITTVAIDMARSDKECAAQLWQGYQNSIQAASDAYKLTPEYAERQLARQQEIAANSAIENNSFQAAIEILADKASSPDTNPALYKALGSWILANDDVGTALAPAHKPSLLDALEAAGFSNNEGGGNPAVKDKSDLRAYGRYCVGQMLDMGRATSGICAGGAIHPLLGEWMAAHASNPELAMLHKIAMRKAPNSSYEAHSTTGPQPH